jgi:hypothetical protein
MDVLSTGKGMGPVTAITDSGDTSARHSQRKWVDHHGGEGVSIPMQNRFYCPNHDQHRNDADDEPSSGVSPLTTHKNTRRGEVYSCKSARSNSACIGQR